jgi:transposase
VIHTTPANLRDDKPVAEMVQAIPPIVLPEGQEQQTPPALIGDRGYGFPMLIAVISFLGFISQLCPRCSPHGSGLGKRRYVIERTMSWFGNFRRLKLCYEKKATHFQTFHELAACIICANKLSDVT